MKASTWSRQPDGPSAQGTALESVFPRQTTSYSGPRRGASVNGLRQNGPFVFDRNLGFGSKSRRRPRQAPSY